MLTFSTTSGVKVKKFLPFLKSIHVPSFNRYVSSCSPPPLEELPEPPPSLAVEDVLLVVPPSTLIALPPASLVKLILGIIPKLKSLKYPI